MSIHAPIQDSTYLPNLLYWLLVLMVEVIPCPVRTISKGKALDKVSANLLSLPGICIASYSYSAILALHLCILGAGFFKFFNQIRAMLSVNRVKRRPCKI